AYAHGKINAITVNGQPLLQNISHAPFGPVSGWTWGNGLPHLRAHGLDGEIQLIESAVAQNYGYDAAGQLTQIHQWSQLAPPQNDTVNSYGYDASGRLTQANTQAQLPTGPYAITQGYTYDANGNRSQLSSNSAQTHYAYSANRLTNSTGAAAKTYTYDAAGRMTGDGNYTYSYNTLGRLVTVQSGARNIASYAYNALGQRVSKVGVRFVHDESGHLLGEYDQRGNLIQELVWLEDLPVASLRPGPKGGKTTVAYYIHPDHLGTPRQITDSSNQIVWRWDSPDPFGNALPDENPDNGKGKRNGVFEFNLRFAGQYYDKETGRHQNWWRVYDSGTGRYIQSDPIGLDGGTNRYTYVGGNPLSMTDPEGLMGGGGNHAPAPCKCPIPPVGPPGACVKDNIDIAKDYPAWNPGAMAGLYENVKNHGPWDYKRKGSQYEDFGNFNFGAVTAAMGVSAYGAQNAAGIYQQWNGAAAAGSGIPFLRWPYGDDASDAVQIERGRQYFKCGCK
ncbi:MAG: RHS repeat-associated core domain-containing protein, partial [Thermoleophilia bacterium]